MKRMILAACVIVTTFTIACEKKPGPEQNRPPVAKSGDCTKANPKLYWTGDGMCAEEKDKNHLSQPAINIVAGECNGIHIKHTKDYTLNLMTLSDNSTNSCPANPFETNFPFDSSQAKTKDFDTGKVKDKNMKTAVGCQYEIYFKPTNDPTCDPHVAITGSGGTP